MWGKPMKYELFNYLKSFMIESNWEYDNVPKQARAIFTTLCFVGNVMADTSECDGYLWILYNEAELMYTMDFDDFVNFMIELIV